MIRQRKEGSTYASWFIGFDHELPNQSTKVPNSNKSGLRASSLEPLLATPSPSKNPRSGTPIGTQTHTPHRQAGQPIPTQTSLDVGESGVQTQTQTDSQTNPEVSVSKRPRTVSTGTETGVDLNLDLGRKTPTVSNAVETFGQQTSPQEEIYHRGSPFENGDRRHNGRYEDEPRSGRIASTETSRDLGVSVSPRSRTNSGSGARPRSVDPDSLRERRRRDRETKGLYREAFDGARRAEEFKFRIKFDQFLGDLHGALDERSPHGLPASFASPSYGEVMLIFRDKVKDLLKGFTHRLQLAHESFGNVESPDETAQKVKQDVSKFIEDLIGETLDLTSDEAVSDLSSLSDEASPDHPPSFEDLLAQAVVTKLLENHRKAVRDSLEPANDNDRLNHHHNNIYGNNNNHNNNGNYSSNHRSFDQVDRRSGEDDVDHSQRQYNRQNFPPFSPSPKEHNRVRNFISLDQDFLFDTSVDRRDFNSSDGGSRDFRSSSGDIRGTPIRTQHPRDVFGGFRQVSVTSLHTDPTLGDGDTLYSRTVTNQNIVNTSTDPSTLVVPQRRLSSDEDEEGDVRIKDAGEESSKNNGHSSHNHSHAIKTSRQHSTSSTSSVEPETLTKDHYRSNNTTHHNDSNNTTNHNNSNSFEESSLANDHDTTAQLNGESVEDTEEPEVIAYADPEKDFLELKDFVRRTQAQSRPRVQARSLEELSEQVEVQEEEFLAEAIDRDEEREQFHVRYSVFDRVHNAEPALPDFSQFENIDFSSNEIDPDLLSMNLAIIPEETEEELEQEEDDDGEDGKWRNNWIFKGKGVSAYDNLGKKKVGRFDQDGPLIMMVPRPEDDYVPRVGNRDVDQLSDFSEGDLLTRSDLDNTDDDDDYEDDDEENSFYANTSKELARIARRRLRSSRDHKKNGSRFENKLIPELDKDSTDFDLESHQDQILEDIPGPIVEPTKPDVKLLYDLIPADSDDPRFLTPPESVTIQEGEPVQFSCRVTGTQPYDVFWYREGDEVEELEEGEDVEMGSTGDKYWMTVHHVGHKQAGQYMCIALSDKGKAIQYLVITVKDNKQDLKKPEFLKGLKDVEVTEGESVKFRVKVKGYPQPRVTWFKDGNILKPSRSCRIEKFGNRDYILTIDYATMDDDAEYTVSARNVAGTEKLSAQVIVEPRSELPPRRQIMSSLNTSAASDSDSDITAGYKRRSYNVANSKPPASSSPLLVAARRSASPSSLNPPTSLDQRQQAGRGSSEHAPLLPASQSGEKAELTSQAQAVSSLIDELPASLGSLGAVSSPPRAALQERENELHLNHLDRQVTLTQKRVEEEAEKMQEDSKKNDASSKDGKPHTAPSASKDIMAAAEEILRLETAGPIAGSISSEPAEIVAEKTKTVPTLELDLPDELDDFPLPGIPAKSKSAPVKSTFTLSVGRKNSNSGSESDTRVNSGKNDDTDSEDASVGRQQKHSGREKFKSETSLPRANKNVSLGTSEAASAEITSPSQPISPLHQRYLHTAAPAFANLNNLSFDSGQGGSLAGGENSASLASSVSSSTSSLGGGNAEVEEGQLLSPSRVKGRYARDFDLAPTQQTQQQKKKWSVTLDPFSPQAEVVNKQGQGSSVYKTPEVEIQEAILSGSSGQSSPSSATSTLTPTLSRPPPRERAAPVHMVGTSSEAEVPESRTEFNTDGSVELPSVNRLKALFSSQKDDMLAEGSFKRVAKHDQIHSITARSFSKQQLEKLKANNQNSSSPLSSSSSSSPSAHRLRSPLAVSQSSLQSQSQNSSSASLQLSSHLSVSTPSLNTAQRADSNSPSFASKVTLRPVSVATSPQQQPEKPHRRLSQIEDGSYLDVDADKDPVLIYPEKDTDYWRRQHKLLLQERQQQQQQQSQQQQQQQQHQQQLEDKDSSLNSRSPYSPQLSEQELSPASSTRTLGGTSSPGHGGKSLRAQQPRLIVRRANSDISLDDLDGSSVSSPAGGSGGTRIKAGCISARAAFWEKKMMDGGEGVDEDEFPEMVEESDS
ncbi:hypothetical protein EGW08_015220 [Elysia chlorotica]|uniref:Ig-like domain-containing protein n=1 Tax=Elysia chlorotica TaxID=188477 RepID=A0A3S0ZEE6_ELYCH|nr:hypothetical protein EGW08_015220 [Elysia chlorotica]